MCAINAPSALNKQPWEIRVIQKPELLKAINDGFVKFAAGKQMQGSASRSQQPGFSIFHGAPTLIIVAGNKNEAYNTVDCALLGQNVVLSAESMGIGSCIIGSVVAYLNTPEAQAKIIPQLKLPANYQLVYTIALGYKNEYPDAKPRNNSKVQIIK
jgi:nitroreductase